MPAPGHVARGHGTRVRFEGPGEMRARCRAFDWSATALGVVETWAPSLRTTAETVLATAFPAVVLWGPRLVQLYNDAYVPLLGVKHPSGLGQPTRACWPEVWDSNAPIYARVLRGETVLVEDARFPIKRQGADGPAEEFFLTASYSPVRDEAGDVGGVLVTLIDTTAQVVGRAAQAEHRQLEVRLRGALLETALVLDQVSDGYFVMDSAFRIVALNQSAERALGRPRATLLGKTHWEAFPASVGAEPERQYRRVAAERVETHFVHHYVGEGYDFHLEIDAYPARDGGVAVFWRDVSARVRAEAERGRLLAATEGARAAAEAASRAKSDFLAVMSHELRTPLNAIGGYAELIEMGIRGPVTAQQREDLARIQKSQRHLLAMINEVLSYARLESGAVTYDLADVPVAEAVVAAEVLVAPQLRAKGLRYTGSECDAALAVRADRDKLQQILLNLLSNAVKFTNAREGLPGRVEVVWEADGGDTADRVRIRVRDTGVGVPADKLEAVFEPFVQVDARLARAHGGTGLGLAISRDLARGMGGDLTVESTLGVGSTFTLTLPAAAPGR
ncbi:MAG: ATP-binding protein [Gemmatimonadaceae bacterium]